MNARGGVVTVAGTYEIGLLDATGPAARFFLPNACALAPDGTLCVRQDSGLIRKISF